LGQYSIKSSGDGVAIAIKRQFDSVGPASAISCEEMWFRVCFNGLKLFVCGVYLPHSAPDDFCQRHIDSVERVIGSYGDGDLVLVCGDFNLFEVAWSNQDDELCPLNVTSDREFIVVDGMANSDLFQVNPIPNQYGVYLDLVYCNFPELIGVGVAEKPLLRLDRHHPAFILTCKISYLKYISLGRRVKRFDFSRADVDGICVQLAAVDWCALF
jgi:hypothetical protein